MVIGDESGATHLNGVGNKGLPTFPGLAGMRSRSKSQSLPHLEDLSIWQVVQIWSETVPQTFLGNLFIAHLLVYLHWCHSEFRDPLCFLPTELSQTHGIS